MKVNSKEVKDTFAIRAQVHCVSLQPSINDLRIEAKLHICIK